MWAKPEPKSTFTQVRSTDVRRNTLSPSMYWKLQPLPSPVRRAASVKAIAQPYP